MICTSLFPSQLVAVHQKGCCLMLHKDHSNWLRYVLPSFHFFILAPLIAKKLLHFCSIKRSNPNHSWSLLINYFEIADHRNRKLLRRPHCTWLAWLQAWFACHRLDASLCRSAFSATERSFWMSSAAFYSPCCCHHQIFLFIPDIPHIRQFSANSDTPSCWTALIDRQHDSFSLWIFQQLRAGH